MAQTKQQIQAYLAAAAAHPRHRFGQNFMIDQNIIRLIVDSAGVVMGDSVIEIGPGTGTLTEELLARGARVIAVEIDRDLAKHLRGLFAENPQFSLIEGDALDSKHVINSDLRARVAGVHPIKLVANLPYNIASPLVVDLLIEGVDELVFTVQKEVADRLKGDAGSDHYGPLSVMVQMLGEVSVLRTLPAQAFWPAPKIESALVRIVRSDRLGQSARSFGIFVQQLFSFRRKTIRKSLDMMELRADDILRAMQIDPSRRAEEFAPQVIFDLFRQSDLLNPRL